ncbi:Protein of unknown function [Bacillus mycoides]|nr:Protein of unknown function [Bacillus mycoides]
MVRAFILNKLCAIGFFVPIGAG